MEGLEEALDQPPLARHSATHLPEAVFKAAHMGHYPPVHEFLNSRGDVNAKDGLMKGTLLMAAAAALHLDLVNLLLQAGAGINLTDAYGCTALASAACPLEYQPARLELAEGARLTPSVGAVWGGINSSSSSSSESSSNSNSSSSSSNSSGSKLHRNTGSTAHYTEHSLRVQAPLRSRRAGRSCSV